MKVFKVGFESCGDRFYRYVCAKSFYVFSEWALHEYGGAVFCLQEVKRLPKGLYASDLDIATV